MELITGEEKNLFLEIEANNHEYREVLTITPSGLIGSIRTKKEEDDCTYFGYLTNSENVKNYKLILIIIINFRFILIIIYQLHK